MVKTFLLALLLGTTASAQISNVDRAIVERGRNLLTNGGFESGRASWTASGGTFTTTTTSSEVGIGSVSGVWDSNAAAQSLRTALIPVPTALQGQNGEFYCRVQTPTGTATHTIEVNDGTNTLARANVLSSTRYVQSGANFIFPTSGSIRLEIDSVNANEPSIRVDDCYLGSATNIGTVSQATLYATAKQTGSATVGHCTYLENTSTGLTNYVDLGLSGTCTQSWTTVGNISIPANTDYKPTLANLPPGRYKVSLYGVFYGNATGTCWYRLTDGTTNGGWTHSPAAPNSTLSTAQFITGYFDYTTAQSSVQFKIQAADDHAGSCGLWNEAQTDRQLYWVIERFPTSAETITSQGQRLPTVQRLTTGSGTYNTPAGATVLKIKMVGGGGGATGTGSSLTGGAGGAGGDTTFGSFLIAGGASAVSRGAETYGGAGGTPTVNSPAIALLSLAGATGHGNQFSDTTSVRNAGLPGAASPFGGAGQGGSAGGAAGAGGNAVANSGSGGGAPGNTSFGQQWTGTSGGAGAYIEALILNPSSSYSYSIGAGGSGGTAGTNGAAGGSGGSGVIIVEEYYGSMNMPLIIGSVTSNSSGALREEGAVFVCGTSSSITRQTGSWLSSIGSGTSGRCTLNIAAGMFSSAPICSVSFASSARNAGWVQMEGDPTTTTAFIYVADGTTSLNNQTIHIRCLGNR